MQLQNSYIFLPNPYKKENRAEKQDNVIYVKTVDSFLSCLKAAFPNVVRDAECSSLFKSIYTCNINIGATSCEVRFLINSVAYKVSNKEVEEIARWQRFFYSFEFSDIQKLLFTPGWTDIDAHSKKKFLEENADLSLLTDEELRTAFAQYTPKSDWDRFFSNKISESGFDAKKIIEEIRKSRNNIAHCKFFYNPEYISCSKAIRSLNKVLISAIKITEYNDFSDKNREYIVNSMAGAFEKITMLTQKIADSIKPALQVMEKIGETVTRFSELYLKYDFSAPISVLENLSTSLALPDNSTTEKEEDEKESGDEENLDA